MPVILEPQYDPTSAYQPIVYRTFFTAGAGLEIPYTRFTVYVEGSPIATDKKAFYTTAPTFGAIEYYFEVDIQYYLQQYLASSGNKYSMFGTLDDATQTTNPDAYVTVFVVFEYLLRDTATNKITVAPAGDISDVRDVCITIRQNGQDRSLSDYIGIPAVDAIQYLTDRPSPIPVCEETNTFISFLAYMNFMRVQTYTAGAVQISDEYAPTGSLPNEQTTVGVGIPQLLAITGWLSAAPVFTGAAYYVITFGIGAPIGGGGIIFLGNSVQRTYTITQGCCGRSLKLFWLNYLGGVDNYEFDYEALEGKVSGTEFEKPLLWQAGVEPPHLQYDHGRALNNLKVERAYKVKGIVKATELNWLRGLFWSAQMFMRNPDGSPEHWRVFIQPGTYTEKQNKGGIEIEFTLNISQNVITHRI